MKSDATTPAEYLAELPPERRTAIAAVRATVLENLPTGFAEGIEFGMLSYHIPLARYPNTYNKRPLGIAALANQKQYMALYLMAIYADEAERAWFEDAWTATGRRLDMGKSCVRFKQLRDVSLEVVAAAVSRVTVDDYISRYEASRR